MGFTLMNLIRFLIHLIHLIRLIHLIHLHQSSEEEFDRKNHKPLDWGCRTVLRIDLLRHRHTLQISNCCCNNQTLEDHNPLRLAQCCFHIQPGHNRCSFVKWDLLFSKPTSPQRCTALHSHHHRQYSCHHIAHYSNLQ